MSSAVSIINPKFYAWDNDTGRPLAFGKVYTYETGTNTPKSTYTSEGGTVENTNPVVLNGAGYAEIYLRGTYKIVVKDSNDQMVWAADPVTDPSGLTQEWVNERSASRESPNSFSISGDQSDIYTLGRAVRLDDGVYDYGAVEAVSYDGSKTIVDVAGADPLGTGLSRVWTGIVSSITVPTIGQDGTSIVTVGTAGSQPGKVPTNNDLRVNTLANLQALDTSKARSVQMLGRSTAGDGAAGTFVWDSNDLSTEVGNDEMTAGEGDGGVYIAPSSDRSGVSGAWVRQSWTLLTPEMWGAAEGQDDTAAIQAAVDFRERQGGGAVTFFPRTYEATRLLIKANVAWKGTFGETAILCTDSTTKDSSSSFGSFLKRLDDDSFIFRASFEGIRFATALSGLAAAQDNNQDVIGLNLCGCAYTSVINCVSQGFGQGSVVLARAEGGTEGLGFVTTIKDGNYNTFVNFQAGSSGKYNAERSAVWFKYKANSNKMYGVFAKGSTDICFGFTFANDNLIDGASVESAETIAYFGSSAYDNNIISSRAEGLSSHAYDFHSDSSGNQVFGGHYSSVSGNHANNIENTDSNTVITPVVDWVGVKEFPPTSGVSSKHDISTATFTAINGDNERPLWVKSPKYNDGSTHPVIRFWDSKRGPVAGDVIGSFEFLNFDSSSGAGGVNAEIQAISSGITGETDIVVSLGTGGATSEKFRVGLDGNITLTDPGAGLKLKSPNGTEYTISVQDNGSVIAT